ncbi:MAG: bifunctional (p)ppGpp synthetase/guanosine-3',5'-bis(diphosphate) 3'-pyrophosphohydrolase [Chthonomonadetes bacterium]|nr:bifunctional (p)ppGpp synthetase/guanosine-3',5'-bis(diphosphate) 3'-pyrophosphohydrolase [Chthonomonadetes bacterium]
MLYEAIEFAVERHHGQFRKGTNIPYVLHPLNVGYILLQAGCEEEVAVAGFLHDTLEDTSTTVDELRHRFGERVAWLVEQVSESDRSQPWKERKQRTIAHLRQVKDQAVLLVACADKIDNLQALADSVRMYGDAVWERFNAPLPAQRWYYTTLVEIFVAQLTKEPGPLLATRAAEAVRRVFGE